MKIIGHRGAAGLALENTIASIIAAKKAGVDAIEIDVRLTSDNQFVLSHDANLKRVGGVRHAIAETTLQELKQAKLKNGEYVPTLQEAMDAIGDTPVSIEAKGSGWAHLLADALQSYPERHVTVIARDKNDLVTFQELMPDTPLYLIQPYNPIDTLQAVREADHCEFAGVTINFFLLTPLLYWLARRSGLKITIYTVNSALLARVLLRFFPAIDITTNRPDRLAALRKRVIRNKPIVT